VLEALCACCRKPTCSAVYDPQLVSPAIRQRHITASFLNPLGGTIARCCTHALALEHSTAQL